MEMDQVGKTTGAGTGCSTSSSSKSEEEEEEENMSLKPPDPCLLCGGPAVHYDVGGNVIKRESPLPPVGLYKRKKRGVGVVEHSTPDSSSSSSSSCFFINCIFKCFRVEEEESHRLLRFRNSVGGQPNSNNFPSLPLCVSCEELVVMLHQMYDNVEELENVLKGKAREAERKFVEEELYRKYDAGFYYGPLRRVLLGAGGKENGIQQVPRIKEMRTKTSDRKQDQTTVSSKSKKFDMRRTKTKSARRLTSNDDDTFNHLSADESNQYEDEEEEGSSADIVTNIICEPSLDDFHTDATIQNDEKLVIVEEDSGPGGLPFLETSHDDDDDTNEPTNTNSSPIVVSEVASGRKVSPRKRQVRNYAESSSSSSSDQDDHSDNYNDDAEFMLEAVGETTSSDDESAEGEGVEESNDEVKEQGRLKKIVSRPRTTSPEDEKKPTRRKLSYNKIKKLEKASSRPNSPICKIDPETGRPLTKREIHRLHQKRYYNRIKERIRRPRPPNPNPFLVKNDKTCRFDPSTGNIFYTYGYARQRSVSGTPPSSQVTLEFVKQTASTYTCSSCSRTISFRGGPGGKIGTMPLLNHARLYHAKSAGVCPVCGMPVLSFCHSDYYSHRLSHLSEEERAEALSNPLTKSNGKCPRFPPLGKKRKITPESASLHGDVRQCPTCGKFIANGLGALRRHEKTHLSPVDNKSYLCAACGAAFTTQYCLDRHRLQNHSNSSNKDGGGDDGGGGGDSIKLYTCTLCTAQCRVFKSEASLGVHMRKNVHRTGRTGPPPRSDHAANLPFRCTRCSRSFATSKSLKHHVSMIHVKQEGIDGSSSSWTCQFYSCKRRFGSKEERLQHYAAVHPATKVAKESRAPDQSFRCEYPDCQRGFPEEAHLQAHVRQEHHHHSSSSIPPPKKKNGGGGGGGGVMCSLCGKVLVNDWSLKQHSLLHTGSRSHVCHHCNAGFLLRSTLLSHLAAKHGEGPLAGNFVCQQQPGCDKNNKVFQSRVLFNHHMRQVHGIFAGGKGNYNNNSRAKNQSLDEVRRRRGFN